MANTGRYLCGNKGTETPTNVICFATENRVERVVGSETRSEAYLRYWHAIRFRIERGKQTRRVEASGENDNSFWDFVDKNSDKRRATWIFSEDLGHDLTKLQFWMRLDEGIFSLKPRATSGNDLPGSEPTFGQCRLSVDSLPTYIICRSGLRLYKFVDARNYWRAGVFDTVSPFGIARYNPCSVCDNQDIWTTHCRRNCEIVEHGIVSLIEGWRSGDCGVFQLTAGSMAMNSFRHTCPIRVPGTDKLDIVCKPNAKEHELERLAYHGGRTTCFKVGRIKGPVYHLDINSLFPFVMREHDYPRRFVRYQKSATIDELKAIMRCYGVVANVLIDSPIHSYPVRIDGKQYHCRGRFWAALCGAELARAICEESVLAIGTLQVYSVARLFAKWVDRWYLEKIGTAGDGLGNTGKAAFAKLILNSIYGKWAQKGKYWRDTTERIARERWGSWTEYDASDGSYRRYRGIANNTQCLSEGSEPRHSFPLISAMISANAREYMKAIIDNMPDKSVYYQAVDAIFTNEQGYRHLIAKGMVDPVAIGKFKVKEVYSDVWLFGPNNYEADGVVTSSGLLGKYHSDYGMDGYVDLEDQLPSIIATEPKASVPMRKVPVPQIHSDYRGNIGKGGWWSPIYYAPTAIKVPGLEDFPFHPECSSDNREARTVPVS